MASGFVNQFDPPRRYDRKSKLPSSLLNFEQNRLRTKRLSKTIENPASTQTLSNRPASFNPNQSLESRTNNTVSFNPEQNFESETNNPVSFNPEQNFESETNVIIPAINPVNNQEIDNNFENNTSSFENVMKKKQINEFNGSGSRTEFMTTEDGIFTLNTEDNQAIILE
jgi:hypothetical protein